MCLGRSLRGLPAAAGPIGLIAVAIGAIVAAFTLANKKGQEFKQIDRLAAAAGLTFNKMGRQARGIAFLTTSVEEGRRAIASLAIAANDALFNLEMFGEISPKQFIAFGRLGLDAIKTLRQVARDPIQAVMEIGQSDEFQKFGSAYQTRFLQHTLGIEQGLASLYQQLAAAASDPAEVERIEKAIKDYVPVQEDVRNNLKEINTNIQYMAGDFANKLLDELSDVIELLTKISGYFPDLSKAVDWVGNIFSPFSSASDSSSGDSTGGGKYTSAQIQQAMADLDAGRTQNLTDAHKFVMRLNPGKYGPSSNAPNTTDTQPTSSASGSGATGSSGNVITMQNTYYIEGATDPLVLANTLTDEQKRQLEELSL